MYNETDWFSNYINYFKDLLFVNYSRAYNMLDNSFKNKIGSLDDFKVEREKLYKKLNNIIKSYSTSSENDIKTYIIILGNDVKITLTENSIMNVKYKIENY